jgi:hypothetical protein
MRPKLDLDAAMRAYALRVPTELYLGLQDLARREGRSVNRQIVWILAQAIEQGKESACHQQPQQ